MPKTKISEFDSTPANNTDIDNINIAEGCAPSGINNAIRELMSQLKDQQTGAAGDNFTVGGNLSVTGTSTFTGATTFTGAVVMSTALPVASGGTGASTAGNARTNLSAASSGANSDITSITGLTTALAVAQGGTGVATHTSKGVLIGNGTSAVTTVSPGTLGNVLTSDGTSWTSTAGAFALTSGTAVATTSGTTIDFTSLPSWVKRITVMLVGVSTSGTSDFWLRLGTSSGFATGGYVGYNLRDAGSGNSYNALSSAFILTAGGALDSELFSGNIVITNQTSNVWIATGQVTGSTTTGNFNNLAGYVSLSGALTQIRLTSASSDTFDAGTINILYE